MAPEVIKGEDHTFALDFWSLGVIAFEFLTGTLPFNDETPKQVFQRILNRTIKFPEIGTEEGMMSQEAYDLINKLLTMDPKKRLGSKGIQEIKKHPFFAEVDWAHLMETEAPFVPGGKENDTTFFPNATD